MRFMLAIIGLVLHAFDIHLSETTACRLRLTNHISNWQITCSYLISGKPPMLAYLHGSLSYKWDRDARIAQRIWN